MTRDMSALADAADALTVADRCWRGSRVILAMLAVIILANGASAYLSIARITSAEQWVHHTLQVQLALDQLLVSVVAAERAARAYVLTGDREFIEQYTQSVAEVHGTAASIDVLTRDNPAQHERADELQPRLRHVLEWCSNLVNARSGGFADLAMRKIATGQGYALTDAFRVAQRQMRREEESLLANRADVASRVIRSETIVLSIATSVSLLAIWGLGCVLRRTLHRPDVSSAA